jgi:EF hand
MMKSTAATFSKIGIAKFAPWLALSVLAVGLATVAGSARAETKKAQVAVAIAAPIYIDASPRIYASKYRHVSRYGAYYAPRLITPAPNARDDFSDDDYPESEQDDFELADLNDDGFISLREARRSQADWARDFRRIDTSGDGYLTREEIDAFYRR